MTVMEQSRSKEQSKEQSKSKARTTSKRTFCELTDAKKGTGAEL